MNLKKTAVITALGLALGGGVATAQAVIVDASWSGVFTMLDPQGGAIQNTSLPHYYDPTWGYGFRTQISGTLSFDTSTGSGTASTTPFHFYYDPFQFHDIALQAIGDGAGGAGTLIAARMLFDWNGNYNVPVDLVFDGAGFLGALTSGVSTSTTISGVGATPASDGIKSGKYPIGPAPLVTTSFDTDFYSDPNCVLTNSCITGDDGIGGSPMVSGPFPDLNINIDVLSMHVTQAVPLPAAVWLLGSGLMGLVGMARHRKHKDHPENP